MKKSVQQMQCILDEMRTIKNEVCSSNQSKIPGSMELKFNPCSTSPRKRFIVTVVQENFPTVEFAERSTTKTPTSEISWRRTTASKNQNARAAASQILSSINLQLSMTAITLLTLWILKKVKSRKSLM